MGGQFEEEKQILVAKIVKPLGKVSFRISLEKELQRPSKSLLQSKG